MPEKITAYRCKFRCGHRVNTVKASIETHEKTCFHNPERKACRTCKYNQEIHTPIDGKFGHFTASWECIKDGFIPPEMYLKHGSAWDCSGWEYLLDG